MFDRSNWTISRYFNKVLDAIIKLHFDYIIRPSEGTRSKILSGSMFYPYFKIPLEEQQRFWNKKGYLSQNVMATCVFDIQFTYILAGWEGSTTDSPQFQMLKGVPPFSNKIQTKIVLVCCILHNYIHGEDYNDLFELEDDDSGGELSGRGDAVQLGAMDDTDNDDSDGLEDEGSQVTSIRRQHALESTRAAQFRDVIATSMWNDK
ncbi:uncharacterized protein [Aristolochia californica]|uniref:uncharacterized protein n=1 Tax=Aristolochia californica TaxID=171875 RepID=UPI0035DA5D37